MDDVNPNLPEAAQRKLDNAITTYYQHPTVQKINTLLDFMNNSELLKKKTAWAPAVGFLTVVFPRNKEHVFDWISRYDYNAYAQDVIVAALLHAKLKETALLFVQAQQWRKFETDTIRKLDDTIDLKHFPVKIPGHIDTLWGAFFGSGDRVYVDEIIDVLTVEADEVNPRHLPPTVVRRTPAQENKELAETTLRQYAPLHQPVREALEARIAMEKDPVNKLLLENILETDSPAAAPRHSDAAVMAVGGGAVLLALALIIARRRKKA